MARILITGANRGIGLQLTRQFLAREDEVIAVCREPGDELAATQARIITGVDVTEHGSVRSLAADLAGERLDRLINNAGILERDALDELDFESIERQFQVNAMGPLRVTAALRGQLAEGSKVFMITSRMGSIDDNTSGAYYGYRMSKAALNMAAKSLSRDLAENGIGVYLLHPGYVATAMTNHQGTPVERAAAGLIERMDSLTLEQSGTFWHQEGYELPW